MKRLLSTISAAFAGSTAGYVAHQVMAAKKSSSPDTKQPPLVVGAPVVTAGIASIVGILFGKRAAIAAFITGAVAAGVMGDKLDSMVPGLADAKKKLTKPGDAAPTA